tara:strand:- start:22243 stop:22665 length:423 start_codon:yes stop_codon:yes gene_type:complete
VDLAGFFHRFDEFDMYDFVIRYPEIMLIVPGISLIIFGFCVWGLFHFSKMQRLHNIELANAPCSDALIQKIREVAIEQEQQDLFDVLLALVAERYPGEVLRRGHLSWMAQQLDLRNTDATLDDVPSLDGKRTERSPNALV